MTTLSNTAMLPERNPFFTGRERLLAEISSLFSSSDGRSPYVLALQGIEGIGKTQLALEYAYRHLDQYHIILCLQASSLSILSTSVRAFADQFSLLDAGQKSESHLFATVKQWLQDQTNWLLLLDHIDDDLSLVDLVLPIRGNGHVLLTTSAQTGGIAVQSLPVTAMSMDTAALFLLRRTHIIPAKASLDEAPTEMVREAMVLAHVLHGIPFALDQAGIYLQATGCGITAYLTLYHQQQATDTILGAIFDGTKNRPVNRAFLYLLTFLHPDGTPEHMLINGASTVSTALHALITHPLRFPKVLADLHTYSLIDMNADRTVLSVRRIVRDVLIHSLTPRQQQRWARQAVRLVNAVFPEIRLDTRAECERMLPHAQYCSLLIRDFQLTLQEGGQLLERLGFYVYQCGRYNETEIYLIQALHLQEHHQQNHPLDLAQTLNSLGLLSARQTHYQAAHDYHHRALALREQMFDPKIAESLHNLADVLLDQGHYQEAEPLYLRVIALEERAPETNDVEMALTMSNLGVLYAYQARYAEAETYYQRALTLYEQVGTPASQKAMTYTLDGLGLLAEKRGDYQQAEALYQRALTLQKTVIGADMIETAHCLNTVADVLEAQGKDEQAEALYLQAFAIGEHMLGLEHPDIALFLNNLAFLASKQGQYQKAEPLYERALSIYEHVLGPEHPHVADVLNNLGQLFSKIGKEDYGEALLRRALTIHEKTLGGTHPSIAQSLCTLADLLSDQHRYEEAERMFQQAFTVYLHLSNPSHTDVVHIPEKYALLLDHMNKSEEAAIVRQRGQIQDD